MKSNDEPTQSKLQHCWDRLEYWEKSWRSEETCCHPDPSERPSANAGMKSIQDVIIIISIKRKKNCSGETRKRLSSWSTWRTNYKKSKKHWKQKYIPNPEEQPSKRFQFWRHQSTIESMNSGSSDPRPLTTDLLSSCAKYLQEAKNPEWMTKEKTAMIEKISKRNHPKLLQNDNVKRREVYFFICFWFCFFFVFVFWGFLLLFFFFCVGGRYTAPYRERKKE